MKALETERLIIRPLTHEDKSFADYILSDNFDYYYGPFKDDKEDLPQRLDWIVSISNWDWAGNMYGDRGIVLKETNELIGLCGIDPWIWFAKTKRKSAPLFKDKRDLNSSSIEFELGYALLEEYRNKGYATEAAKAIVEFAFTKAEIGRIMARTDLDNPDSMKVMKRLEMEVYRSEEWGGFAAMLVNPNLEKL